MGTLEFLGGIEGRNPVVAVAVGNLEGMCEIFPGTSCDGAAVVGCRENEAIMSYKYSRTRGLGLCQLGNETQNSNNEYNWMTNRGASGSEQ